MQGVSEDAKDADNIATWSIQDSTYAAANPAIANGRGPCVCTETQTAANFQLADRGYLITNRANIPQADEPAVVDGALQTNIRTPPQTGRRTGATFSRGSSMHIIGDDTYAPEANQDGDRRQIMFAYPVYTWDHFDTPTSYSNCRPVFPFPSNYGQENVANFWRDFAKSAYTLDVGVEHAFQLRLGGNVDSGHDLLNNSLSVPPLYDAKILDMQHVLLFGTRRLLQWDYTISNIRMIADMCQPSSDVFAEYSKAFQSRIGIPYAISRIMTVDRTFDVGTNGAQQFVVPISARSLKMLMITLDDTYFQNYIRGTSGSMYTPFLSSFMRRGLVNLTVTIGGAQKPEYTLRFDKNGGVEHIIETGSAFGVPFVSGFTPQFNREALMPTRNYFAGSDFDISNTSFLSYWQNRNFPPNTLDSNGFSKPQNLGIDYMDSSKFIIAIPLARTDAFNFAAGLDSTMTANIILTFTFGLDGQPNLPGESVDPGLQWNRQIHVTVRGDVDAVATLNNDQSTLRW